MHGVDFILALGKAGYINNTTTNSTNRGDANQSKVSKSTSTFRKGAGLGSLRKSGFFSSLDRGSAEQQLLLHQGSSKKLKGRKTDVPTSLVGTQRRSRTNLNNH